MHKTQSQKIVDFLKEHSGDKFTARELASSLVQLYPEEYEKKRDNSNYPNEKAFLSQIASEISSQKKALLKHKVTWEDWPKPRRFFIPHVKTDPASSQKPSEPDDYTEEELYPLLILYLKDELMLYPKRIREKTSSNRRGHGGNRWLHPDIVAYQPLEKNLLKDVREFLQASASPRMRFWSFEVKKELNPGNVREAYFQAVSNSTWANEGYLVTTSISDSAESELRMLSALHGIGVILLNKQDPQSSHILFQAAQRPVPDWTSVSRIVDENRDFKDFLEKVNSCLKGANPDHIKWEENPRGSQHSSKKSTSPD